MGAQYFGWMDGFSGETRGVDHGSSNGVCSEQPARRGVGWRRPSRPRERSAICGPLVHAVACVRYAGTGAGAHDFAGAYDGAGAGLDWESQGVKPTRLLRRPLVSSDGRQGAGLRARGRYPRAARTMHGGATRCGLTISGAQGSELVSNSRLQPGRRRGEHVEIALVHEHRHHQHEVDFEQPLVSAPEVEQRAERTHAHEVKVCGE